MNSRRDILLAVSAVLLWTRVVSGQTVAGPVERASGETGADTSVASGMSVIGPAASPDSLASPTDANRVAFAQEPKNTRAGATIVPPVTVQLKDWSRNVSQSGVSIALRISSGTGTLSGTLTRQTNDKGLATFDDLSIDLVGEKRLTASSSGLTEDRSKSFDINLGPPARLKIQREPSQTATAGMPFPQQPEVWVVDAGGNLVTSDNSTQVTAARLAGSGTLQGTLEVTARNGVAKFANLSHNVAGEITILFSGGSLIKDTSTVVRVDPAAAARLVFLQQPVNTAAGTVIVPPVTVRLRDAFGNNVETSGTPVTIALTSGSGTLTGTLTRNTVSGVATFSNLRIDLSGSKRLTATSGTLTSAVSDAFAITAIEPTALGFVQQPTTTEASAQITPPVTVQLRDSLGNAVPRSGVSVSVQLASGTGTLSGTTTRATDGTGLATFGDLSIDRAGQKRLRATGGGLTSDLSSAFAITAARESQLAFVQQPTDAAAGQDISPAVTVQLRDSLGNDVAKAGVTVAIALAAGSSGTLSGSTSQLTDASGLASFSNLSVNLIGVKSLTAIASGMDRPISDTFVITPAPPSRLVFTESPGNATAGTPFSTQPAIALQDQYENRVTGAVQEITIAIHANAGQSGVLGGVTTIPIDTLTGIATFSGLSIDKSGTGYTLTVTGSTVSSIPGAVVSSPFDITPAPASRVRVETVADGSGTLLGTQSVSSGTSITVYAIARDSFENYVSNVPATSWSLLNRTGGILESDLVPAADRRSATFTGGAVGTAVINASVTGLTSVPSGTISVVNNATPMKILVETAANGAGTVVQDQSLLSGSSIVVYAIARDLNNNFVSNVVAEAWSLVDVTGGITSGDLVPDPAGRSAALAGRLAGTARIRATLGELVPTPTGVITVTAGASSVVVAIAGTPQSAKVGTPFAIRLAVKATDAAGNPVSGIVVTFDAPVTGASGTFDAGVNTVVTDTSGAAVAPIFTANSVAGTYTVTARATGAQTVAAFRLTNSALAVGRITAAGGTPQSARVGTIFPTRFAASVQDSFGNPVSGAEVTFAAPATGASGTFPGATLSATVPTNESGIGTAPEFTANPTAGTYTLTATAPGLAGPALFALTNTAGYAASVSPVVGNQQATEVNTPFSTQFKAMVKDASGNPVSGVLVTFVAPGEGAGGAFPWGDTINVATDTSGVAAAPLFIANTIAGAFTVVARAQGVEVPALFELINVPATVNAFLIDAEGGGPIATQMVLVPFDIRVVSQDRFGNIASAFTGTVSLSSSGALTQGAGITPPFTGGVLAEHRVAVQNAGRVVLSALRTGGAEIGMSDTFQVNNPVPSVTGLSPTAGARGQSLSLRVSGSGFLQGVTSVMLGNNITTYETVASDSLITVALNIGSDALEGPRTVLVVNPPPGGGIVNIADGFVVEGIVYPATYDLQNTVMFPAYAQHSEFSGTDYRIVGLPGAPDVLISQYLSGSRDQDWVVFWDDGDTSDYLVPFDGTSTFIFSPGRAFWLLNRGPWIITDTVPTVPLDSTTSVEIPLHPGWNLITNPFMIPIAWADVQSANEPGVTGGLYRFEGSFSTAEVLNPYDGCLFDNAGDMTSLLIPFRQARLSKREVPGPEAWRVQLELTAGDYVERLVSFGVSPEAENGRDGNDWRRPRGVGVIPEAYFSHPEWGAQGGAFATDIRRESGDLQIWLMDVCARPRQPVDILFAGVSTVPDRYSVVLVDDDRGRSVDLRTAPAYAFTPATPVSHFRIAVGIGDSVRGFLEDTLPKEFALENNFPNPFNPSTTIPVTVPRTSAVAVRVYSILGELVRTLHTGSLEAGRHSFEWDGTSQEGRAVSAGVYLVQLTTEGGQRFVGKMLLIK